MSRLPAAMPGLAGSILVRWHPKMPGDDAGGWDARKRVVTLATDLSPLVQEQAFWHEWVHSILDDTGVRLSAGKEEDVCNALALGLICLRNANWIKFRRLPQAGDIDKGR